MFERKDLEQLERFTFNDAYVVSLFLNVSPQERKKQAYLSKFKNLVKTLPEDIHNACKEDINRIEAFLQSERESFKKSIVIYSCSPKNLWVRYDLNVELKDDIIVDRSPYISPLFDLLDNYQKYGVLLVDKRTARVFLVFLGEIEEYGIVEHEDVPGKHKKGGWFALAEKRYERHIDYHVKMHLKDVIEKFNSFLKDKNIRRLIVAGPDEAISELMNILDEEIKQKIVGITNIEKYASKEEVLEKILPIIEGYENLKEEETVSELITRSLKNDNAVMGIDDVLKYLRDKRVMKLIIAKDHRLEGFICKNCGFATTQNVECCMECESCVMKSYNLIEKATEMAIEQAALVEVVKEEKNRKKLLEYGGIGAFLRF
ncbi:MAG: Vms1/Ankzf1 family peptidyl-tRNA hydrolase [Thermodesulfovibrio sp.]